KSIVVGGDDLALYDPATGTELHRWPLKGFVTSHFAFNRGGTLVAVATSENITLVDLQGRKVVRELPLKGKSPHTPSAALAPDGKTVVYPAEGKVQFVDLDTDTVTFGAEPGKFYGLHFTPDGRFLIGTKDDLAVCMNARTGRVIDKKFIGAAGQVI